MESIQTLKFALSFMAIFCGFLIAAFWVYTTFVGRKKSSVIPGLTASSSAAEE